VNARDREEIEGRPVGWRGETLFFAFCVAAIILESWGVWELWKWATR
jgi:hypothetical protein